MTLIPSYFLHLVGNLLIYIDGTQAFDDLGKGEDGSILHLVQSRSKNASIGFAVEGSTDCTNWGD